MKVHRIDHIGIVVTDLPAAIEFFLDLGLELTAEWEMEGPLLEAVVALNGARTSCAMLQAPDGGTSLELIKYLTPPAEPGVHQPAPNSLGIGHISIAVEDLEGIVAKLKARGTEPFSEIQNYEDVYKLLYVRGPEGIILELAEEIG